VTTTEIATIDFDVTAWFAEFIDEYDIAGVQADVLAAINALAPGSAVVAGHGWEGVVYCDVDDADEIGETDWQALIDSIDLDAIAERHHIATNAALHQITDAVHVALTALAPFAGAALRVHPSEIRARCTSIVAELG